MEILFPGAKLSMFCCNTMKRMKFLFEVLKVMVEELEVLC